MAYSELSDIRMGDIPWPSFIDQERFMADISDEMDSWLGFVYETPIDVSQNSPVSRPARLLLKRISVALSTGRAVLEAAAATSDSSMHTYGNRHVNEALATLRQISRGDIEIEGAELIEENQRTRGPLQYNKDPFSNVDMFYERMHPAVVRSQLAERGRYFGA